MHVLVKNVLYTKESKKKEKGEERNLLWQTGCSPPPTFMGAHRNFFRERQGLRDMSSAEREPMTRSRVGAPSGVQRQGVKERSP